MNNHHTLDAAVFRRKLMAWYRLNARKLPWRGSTDPYTIWVSEVMLQQTRVAAVIDHFHRFLARFPTVAELAAAPESEVLTAWSGLGYYRRARMMHRAAKVVADELGGVFPPTSIKLRLLPGIGEYTSAAIASIAFGESIAVLDGNVERVLLRIAGRSEETTAASRNFMRQLAAELVPACAPEGKGNAPGDHNQAMMELGATICLPRGPLCLQCPVYDLCRTRGEHPTPPRGKAKTKATAYLLATRTAGSESEVLLERRPADASLMAGMYELPPLSNDDVTGREPRLRLRHSITDTIYLVEIHTADTALLAAIPANEEMLDWQPSSQLAELPLTGLARKVLRKLKLMA